ncbi:phosphomannose isomerase type II C-terminal cupin domain [Kytococcus sp. HMSC28H12]|uniref:phosphomannose isomerase type II C-terminal cupin domain n=1 Tax=Kytococcus sp. HMSC28H12 TaxID=1581067 RepID=UPI0008A1F71F|nr:phosphomannose isomerase type II C-terminal cupin domain [Kytococcus sp. HMSC28H12]OFS15026.1 mannose-6-phosphate isomerase [Kytococcus sp. HMSC28H12]
MQQDTTDAARRDPRAEVVEDSRPWGRFEQFTHNEQSTVKLITVLPGQRLSLQVHEHRDELWVVTHGPVTAQVGDETATVEAGGRVWIPRGATHRLGNPGTQDAQVLEVAFGTFDEGDIERLEDDYSRG